MYRLSAATIHRHFLQGTLSAEEIVHYFLSRIQKGNEYTGAFLSIFSEQTQIQARLLDQKRKENRPLGKMAGVPIAIKDNIHIKGQLTTCASKFLANYKAVFDACVIRRLKQEDALLMGKTNLDEFAMGSSTEHSAFQITKNPWDLSCSPGGSSGGSAAAVSARLCPLALGSDTGGSIRQPAALTGIVGFKPTYGRISRYGLVAFASSMDQIGPFAATVKDAAYLTEIIAGPSNKDSTCYQKDCPSYTTLLQEPMKKFTIGVPWGFLDQLPSEAKENFTQSLTLCKEQGASLVEVDLDLLKYSIAVYQILSTAEASTNLARYDGIRYGFCSPKAQTLEQIYELSKQEGFGPEVKTRIMLGTYILSSGYKDAYYKKAQKVRTLIVNRLQEIFTKCDLIAMPCSPTPAFALGSIQDPLQMYLQDLYTIAANLAGLPAISVPSGYSKTGKPFGLQIIGPQLQDGAVLQMAHHFEQKAGYYKHIPPLFDHEVLL